MVDGVMKGFKAMYLSMRKKIERREKNLYQHIHRADFFNSIPRIRNAV
ncbi:unnamed protein product [Brassica rapa subsp. narinosa]